MRPSPFAVAVFALALACPAQVPDRQTPPLVPDVRYDPAIPTLGAVIGHEPGAEITSHADVERYLQALAAASPRLRLVHYGTSWEGRRLWYAIVASPANMAKLDEIQAGMQRLADPRGLDDAAAERLLADLPAVGWLAACVHGDEPSGGDALLSILHHLLAAQGDPLVERILEQCVVLVDPLQNPDGRDRFVASTRAARGRFPDAEPRSAEHSQPWPGGRSNHALFDMNRDWFALTQPETQGRVRAFREWWPLVYADLHEMGGNSTFFFPPPAAPVHGEVTAEQRQWLERYGQNNARWFDRAGFEYFTREAFDSFYPGYGEGWPLFQGSIGMTFEMASTRGLVFRREDESLLVYRDCVRRHFTAALATLETLANGRAEALAAFLRFRRAGCVRTGPVRDYVFPARGDRTRLARLCKLLLAQGVEVHRATAELRGSAAPLGGGEAGAVTFPAGSFVVSLAQPASTLAHTLIAPHFDMGEEYLAEQKRREAARLGAEFYDMTAWSLPLLFGVEAWAAAEPVAGERVLLREGEADAGAAPLRAVPPAVGWVVAWGQNGAAALLAALLRDAVRVRCLDRAFTPAGVRSAARRHAALRRQPVGRGRAEPRQQTFAAAEVPARRHGVGRTGVEPECGLAALRARAALRHPGHAAAHARYRPRRARALHGARAAREPRLRRCARPARHGCDQGVRRPRRRARDARFGDALADAGGGRAARVGGGAAGEGGR